MHAVRYLFIPFLMTKPQMGQTKNRSGEKLHKQTDRTHLIATNFICEQLKRNKKKKVEKEEELCFPRKR